MWKLTGRTTDVHVLDNSSRSKKKFQTKVIFHPWYCCAYMYISTDLGNNIGASMTRKQHRCINNNETVLNDWSTIKEMCLVTSN